MSAVSNDATLAHHIDGLDSLARIPNRIPFMRCVECEAMCVLPLKIMERTISVGFVSPIRAYESNKCALALTVYHQNLINNANNVTDSTCTSNDSYYESKATVDR